MRRSTRSPDKRRSGSDNSCSSSSNTDKKKQLSESLIGDNNDTQHARGQSIGTIPKLRPPSARKNQHYELNSDNRSEGRLGSCTGTGILRKRRKHGRSLFTDNSDEDEQCKSPTFFGKLYDKIKAEYFDKSNSRDGSPRKSDAGNLFSLNRVNKSETKKVRNPSQKSIKTEKRVSFIGDSWATLDKN